MQQSAFTDYACQVLAENNIGGIAHVFSHSPGEQPHLLLVHGWPEGHIVLQLPQAKMLLVVS